MIKLLLVNDEPLIRQGLRTWLERTREITVVGEAANATAAILLAEAQRPDIILLDISVPTFDENTSFNALSAVVPGIKVVLLSLYDDAVLRAHAHAAGIQAFVRMQDGADALLAAIRKVANQE